MDSYLLLPEKLTKVRVKNGKKRKSEKVINYAERMFEIWKAVASSLQSEVSRYNDAWSSQTQ